MSATLTKNPLIQAISPMGFGEVSVPIAIDFAADIPTGFAIDPSTVAACMTSIPAGFVFSNVGLAGTKIVFQATAPLVAGEYLLQAAPSLTGATPEPYLPRSISVFVLQT